MQHIDYLKNWAVKHNDNGHYLFALQDLRGLFPNLSDGAFKTLLSRAVSSNILTRVCRGIYINEPKAPKGFILFHSAARLRADKFNYISLETALSDAGVISQIPMNWISIMSSGRSSKINCGKFGTIEFVHTNQRPEDLNAELSYDSQCELWRASVKLALRDMKITHRNCDLIDWDTANELI